AQSPKFSARHQDTPTQHPVSPAQGPEFSARHQDTPTQLATQKKFTCPHCKVKLNKKNFKTHCKRKHSHHFATVSKDRFLACQCVDGKHGVFVVEKSFCGPSTPIHVIKNTWGPTQKIMCEVDQCRLNADFARRSGMLPFECHHIQSLLYCPHTDSQTMTLSHEALETMVKNKWFGEERKALLLHWQQDADAECVPLSEQLTVGGPPSKFHISVYEKKKTYYSRLGRVIVSYDTKQNSWHCPCSKPRQSCIHKAVAKWHLFVTKRELFLKVKSTEAQKPTPTQTTAHQNASGSEEDSPPDDRQIARMLNYLLTNKKLPADLPQTLIKQSRDGKTNDSFPKHLVPKETKCAECENTLCEQLITSTGKILTSTGVVEGISTYRKSCLNCGMIYRYQEWEEGIHNFDDHIILSLHLCLMVRNALQTHTAISKVIEIIETTEKVSFPNKERVLQAYLHFEALTNHDYTYSCVSCGYSPAVVVMDLHKKGVFNMPVSEIPSPPDNYNGHVDINNFWDAVATEIISRGLIPCGRKNPFVVPPSYHHWAPWIGPQTRRSNSVLNTEFEKMQSGKMQNDGENDNDDDEKITEERLTDELVNLKVEEVRALCKQCGVDHRGSKVDLVIRLSEKMSNRVTYNKVFEKVWGASGGWAVITCPCGVVYSVKFNLRAESPRDFVDLLLSWKHLPNISVYDYAKGLAVHANRRQPGIFDPFQGRLLDPSIENIKQASQGKVHVSMPWLKLPKMPADKDGHPLTGSSQHFALNDVFHQGNSKDQREVLRKLELVPELTGLINSQCVEQLFSGMRKNNYFLNLTTPSTHIFLQRNILHHYNVTRNQKMKKEYSKILPPDAALQYDSHGRVVIAHSPSAGMTVGSSDKEQEECQELVNDGSEQKPHGGFISLHTLSAYRTCWGQKLQDSQEQLLSQALDETKSSTEHLAMVNNIILTRFDFWSLGLQRDIDGMILNCCLKVIEKRVEKVFAADSHVISTWFPPLSINPMDHLPDDAVSLQWILLPVFVPGHWMLCILRPQIREIFFLDPLCGSGWRDESKTRLFRHISQSLSPGPWRELGVSDVQGLTKQGCSNNCGVFVLMYALYIVMGANCDFKEENMMQIRRWWCIILLQNFPMPSEEDRLQDRKRRREETRKQGLEVVPSKKLHLSESVSEASAEAETLPELGKWNREDCLLKDTFEAASWCDKRSFKGELSLPQVISMDHEAGLRAVELLYMSEDLDEEEIHDLREPFLFLFTVQADYEEFCVEMMDKRQLQVFCGFDLQ
ncbi:LOW QUALITY PROTEIN: uncharacterized protein LOC121639302, partial [Melanotaenia boesemani]|uniref:LOW QUALITY PROTEIN: uncharacterized protein LOC121639302 n=1 Tax=Melanotaenia boesemani TaxID=1250792 RepID=UPI001C0590B4